jgi:hypothetical protein
MVAVEGPARQGVPGAPREVVGRQWKEQRGQKQLNQVPQPPAADERIRDLRQRSRAELGADIPEEYAELLRLANGFDWNGMVVYAAETTPIPSERDRQSDSLIGRHRTLAALLAEGLRHHQP